VTDMLLAVLTVSAFVVVVGLVAVALVVLPFVLTVDMAERRGFSTARWGAVALVDAGLALATASLVLKHSALLLVLSAVLAWAAPAALSLMDRSQALLGGYQGRHQH
jgi:hypothetical protein